MVAKSLFSGNSVDNGGGGGISVQVRDCPSDPSTTIIIEFVNCCVNFLYLSFSLCDVKHDPTV